MEYISAGENVRTNALEDDAMKKLRGKVSRHRTGATVVCCVLAAMVTLVAGCDHFNRDTLEYLEFYTSTAILSRHEFRTESYRDKQNRLTVPSTTATVIDLYTTNPKDYTLLPQFTATADSGITLSQDIGSYGISIKQDSSNLGHLVATIPQQLLEELDLAASGLSLTIAPVEPESQRVMPEYTLSFRSNARPAFPSNSAIIMQTKNTIGGSKKWVLCFDMPDMDGVHRDIVALEINGKTYTIDPTAGSGAAATNIPTDRLTTLDALDVKDGGASFVTTNSERAVYFVTDIDMGVSANFTVTLRDSAGLTASLPTVSTDTRLYGKEILSFTFESDLNSQLSSIGSLGGTIDGNLISVTVPSTLTDLNMAPTITLSGGTVSPASGTMQDFSQPVTYTVTADDGTTRQYTVTVGRILPKPQLRYDTAESDGTYSVTYPAQAVVATVANTDLPAGTTLNYLLNGTSGSIAADGGSISIPAGEGHTLEYWFTCTDYTPSQHTVETLAVTCRLPSPALKPSVELTDGKYKVMYSSETITLTLDTVDLPENTTLKYSYSGQECTLSVANTSKTIILEKGEYTDFSYWYECSGFTSSDTASLGTFTVVSKLPAPELTISDSQSNSGTKYYTTTGSVTVNASANTVPSGTTLCYTIDGDSTQTITPATSGSTSVTTLDIQGDAYTVTAWYECSGYESSATTKSYTVWLDKSKIKLTATSLNAHTDGTKTATGSDPTLSHNFYGATGSSFSFSVDSSVSNYSNFSISNGSTFTLEHDGSTNKTVYVTKNGSQISDSVTFTTKATMRPITFTLTNVGVQILWTNNTYDHNPRGASNLDSTEVWKCNENQMNISRNNRDIHTGGTLTEKDISADSPDKTFEFWGWMNEMAGSDVDYGATTGYASAKDLYDKINDVWNYTLNDGDWALYYKFSFIQQ